MVLESGLLQEREERYELTGPLPPLAIPATLHDSLMARLDRLATVKGLAQLGATLGREFSYDLLQAVSPWDEATLQRGLQQLVEAEFLYQQGLPPQATYLFKHALIQDAAYQSLLRSTRQQYHQRIAQVLEARFPELCETQPELLAHHYTEAGLLAQAIPYWQRAGQRAIERSANLEAIGHLTKGLEVLTTLPDTPERTQQELDLQTALGPALMATKGYAAPEVEQAYARARELCQQVGETPQLFPVLWGLWRVLYRAGGVPDGAGAGGAAPQPGPARRKTRRSSCEAHQALGHTLFCLGELAPARAHLEQGMALYDPQQHRSHGLPLRAGPRGASAAPMRPWPCGMLGYPDQALQRSQRGAHPGPGAVASPSAWRLPWTCAASLHQFRREAQAAQERAEAADDALDASRGLRFWLASGTILRGWALAEQGQGEEGIAQMRQGLAAWQATGAELGRPHFLALLAEAYGNVGQAEEGLHVLAEALAAVAQHWGALLRGGAVSAQGGAAAGAGSAEQQTEAEACFHQALDVARRQQAKSLELRAAMSLSRLWQQQGKRAEARELLAPIYGWFTEGFDTADLQEAKALLEELT